METPQKAEDEKEKRGLWKHEIKDVFADSMSNRLLTGEKWNGAAKPKHRQGEESD